MLDKITNLVFSGASTKIFLFLGFLKYLEECDKNFLDNIKSFAGTSSGSIISTGLALGFTVSELEELLIKLDFSQFKEINSEGIINFLDNYGLNNCYMFEKVFRIIFKKKINDENITFQELFLKTNKTLTIVASNITRGETIYFNHINTPDIRLIDALISSISIPIIYMPKKINDDLYVDGGLTNNFPINLFEDKIESTLGAVVVQHHTKFETKTFFDFLLVMMFCNIESKNKEILQKYRNVIKLSSDVNIFDFDMDINLKTNIIKLGYDQTLLFFKKNQ